MRSMGLGTCIDRGYLFMIPILSPVAAFDSVASAAHGMQQREFSIDLNKTISRVRGRLGRLGRLAEAPGMLARRIRQWKAARLGDPNVEALESRSWPMEGQPTTDTQRGQVFNISCQAEKLHRPARPMTLNVRLCSALNFCMYGYDGQA